MAECAHRGVPIVDPTTQVVHGDMMFCCPNCSEAMEQHGSGSDTHRAQSAVFRCAHCDVPIVDESTLVSRGDIAFCCANCAAAGAASGAV